MQNRIFLFLSNCHPLIVAQLGMKPAEEDSRQFRVAAQKIALVGLIAKTAYCKKHSVICSAVKYFGIFMTIVYCN